MAPDPKLPHQVLVRIVDRSHITRNFTVDFVCHRCNEFVRIGKNSLGDVCWAHENKALNLPHIKLK